MGIDHLSEPNRRKTSNLSEVTDTTKNAGSENSNDDSLSTVSNSDSSSDSQTGSQSSSTLSCGDSELIAMNKNKKEKQQLFGMCNHSGCYCIQYEAVTSKWLNGKCKSCNHSQKEHAEYKAVNITDALNEDTVF